MAITISNSISVNLFINTLLFHTYDNKLNAAVIAILTGFYEKTQNNLKQVPFNNGVLISSILNQKKINFEQSPYVDIVTVWRDLEKIKSM